MIRMCVIYELGGRLQFAIPLFEFYYMKLLCVELFPSLNSPLKRTHTTEQFVRKIIQLFDKKRLKFRNQTRSISDEKKQHQLLECVYDRLVYYSLCSLQAGSIYPQFQALNDATHVSGFYLFKAIPRKLD